MGRLRCRSAAHDQYLALLVEAGLAEASIVFTHDTGPGLHAAIFRARRM